jgi:hypothetical protein
MPLESKTLSGGLDADEATEIHPRVPVANRRTLGNVFRRLAASVWLAAQSSQTLLATHPPADSIQARTLHSIT